MSPWQGSEKSIHWCCNLTFTSKQAPELGGKAQNKSALLRCGTNTEVPSVGRLGWASTEGMVTQAMPMDKGTSRVAVAAQQDRGLMRTLQQDGKAAAAAAPGGLLFSQGQSSANRAEPPRPHPWAAESPAQVGDIHPMAAGNHSWQCHKGDTEILSSLGKDGSQLPGIQHKHKHEDAATIDSTAPE